MKTIKDEPATHKRGRRVTVELQPGEKLMAFRDEAYYKLGGQLDEIMQGHIITESQHVYWCSITQEWRS